MTQRKPRRPSNLHLLDGEQKQALGKYQKDFQTALPHMQQLAKTAQALHEHMIHAPVHRIVDLPKPEDAPEQQAWSVGHAQVNYVDHIKTEGAEEK